MQDSPGDASPGPVQHDSMEAEMAKKTYTPLVDQVGEYGRVKAHEPIEIEEALGAKLVKRGRFVEGLTEEAKDRQKAINAAIAGSKRKAEAVAKAKADADAKAEFEEAAKAKAEEEAAAKAKTDGKA